MAIISDGVLLLIIHQESNGNPNPNAPAPNTKTLLIPLPPLAHAATLPALSLDFL